MEHDKPDCIECDSRPPINQHGLCGHCNNGLQFIVRPKAHRKLEQESDSVDRYAEELKRQGLHVEVIRVEMPDDSPWVCDFCNTDIPVDNDITLISLLGSYALCPPCVSNIPYWPGAWIEPTPRACPCDACQLPLARARILTQGSSPRVLEDRGIGR